MLSGFFNETTLSLYYRDIHDTYDQFNLRAEVQGAFTLFNTQHQLITGFERNIGGFTLNVFQPDFHHPIPDTTSLDRDTDITDNNALSYNAGLLFTPFDYLRRF